MRLTTLGAIGVGYVLGARAGRDQYERIRQLAEQTAERMEAYGADGPLATRAAQWWEERRPSSGRS